MNDIVFINWHVSIELISFKNKARMDRIANNLITDIVFLIGEKNNYPQSRRIEGEGRLDIRLILYRALLVY